MREQNTWSWAQIRSELTKLVFQVIILYLEQFQQKAYQCCHKVAAIAFQVHEKAFSNTTVTLLHLKYTQTHKSKQMFVGNGCDYLPFASLNQTPSGSTSTPTYFCMLLQIFWGINTCHYIKVYCSIWMH